MRRDRPNRPSQGSSSGEGGKGNQLFKSYVGGLAGGVTGKQSGGGEGPDEGTGEGTTSGPVASKTYSANHPILDALFNGGQGGAAAQSMNFQQDLLRQQNDYASAGRKEEHGLRAQELDKHFQLEATLAQKKSDINVDEMSKKDALELKHLQAKVDQGRQDLYGQIAKADPTLAPGDIWQKIGSMKYTAEQAQQAKDQAVLDTTKSTTAATNATKNLEALKAGQESDARQSNPGAVLEGNVAEFRKPAVANNSLEASTRHIDASTDTLNRPLETFSDKYGNTTKRIFDRTDKSLIGMKGVDVTDPKFAEFQKQQSVAPIYDTRSVGSKAPPNTTPNGRGENVTPLNGRQSSTGPGTGSDAQQNGDIDRSSNLQPPPSKTMMGFDAGDVQNQNPNPFRGGMNGQNAPQTSGMTYEQLKALVRSKIQKDPFDDVLAQAGY